ncbi:hypothetical protein [Pseudomonas sp. S1_G07]
MSSISHGLQTHTLGPPLLPFAPAADPYPDPDTPVRAKRSAPQPPAPQTSAWTLPPLPAAAPDATAAADRLLQASLGGATLRQAADRKVQVPADATIFPLYDAYRRALNTPELRAWFLSKGLVLSTLVIKPGSVSGSVMRDGVSSVQTFTTSDSSGWWQVSARLRSALSGLDPQGNGLPYASGDGDQFSRNAMLRWYGVQPPVGSGDAQHVEHALAQADWSALPAAQKADLQHRVQAARQAIGTLDERAHLANILTERIADKPDDEAVALADMPVQVSSTSTLTTDSAGKARLEDILQAHGRPLPTTVGELRNLVRWLMAALPPPPPQGNYTHLLASTWAPGRLSSADKTFLAQLRDDPAAEFNLLAVLDVGGIVNRSTPEHLRAHADDYLDQLLITHVALVWGQALGFNRKFRGASGNTQLSADECKQWIIAAIKLQIDPDAPGRPGTIAGYDIYQPANNGRSLAAVRADIEAHLLKNKRLNPKAAPLVAHLLLASAAPEFLVRDVPPTLRMGSMQWADLRLGVAFAERQGGAGCSRAMNHDEIMALSRLDPSTVEEAAVLDNHGVDALLDWGLMQGIYPKPDDERYTPPHYQQASEAFQARREQMLIALQVFKRPLPTRRDLAIAHLQTVFPGLSVEQLQALKVHIADPDVRRNMKQSEPMTRSLIETYMTGDLVKDRWMLLVPGATVPQRPPPKSPFDFNRGLRPADQAAVDQNVRELNGKIAELPDVQALLPGEVDTYLADLKQALGTTTRRMIAELPLADRQALEYGSVELFALREQTDAVLVLEQTAGQVEERRGRKGTLIRCVYDGKVSYFEVFADKMLIVKREDLPDQLKVGGTLESVQKTYGPWAPTSVQVQNGAQEPFDFAAYTSNALPQPGVTSSGIIIDKLGDTLAAAPAPAAGDSQERVPDSFASARTEAIVERIMQGNFVHHRDTVLKNARGELPVEQRREVSRLNDRLLLSLIPFVGAFMELAKGNIIEGTRGLMIDTFGALLGGAGSTLRPLVKSTKVVAPFGAKAFRVLENGVTVVSAFLNPLDGAAKLLSGGVKGVFALPTAVNKLPKASAVSTLVAAEEKLRTYFGLQGGLHQIQLEQDAAGQAAAQDGHNHAVPVRAVQSDGEWYAINPQNGTLIGTPLEDFKPSSAA